MDFEKRTPSAVVRRLPKYYRYLKALMQMGISRISSNDLGRRMEITSSQVRHDFFSFGNFGLQGYGYDVDILHDKMCDILGLDLEYKLIVIGAGNLGQALVKHTDFEKLGYKVVGVFDVNPNLTGEKIRGIEIMHLDRLSAVIKENDADIAVITVPAAYANETAGMVINLGIKAIWNFAPVDLKAPNDVVVENMHLSDSLMILGYMLKEIRESKTKK